MKQIIVIAVVAAGILGFLYYENNLDTQSICSSYLMKDIKEDMNKNPAKVLKYSSKRRNACNAELLKKRKIQSETQLNSSCKLLNSATVSTLTYASVVNKTFKDKTSAQKALKETIENIKPYQSCPEYGLYNSMLQQSLLKKQTLEKIKK